MRFGYVAKILLFIPLYCVWVMGTLAFSLALFEPLNAEFLGVVLYIGLLFPPIWLFMKVLNAQPRWMKGVLADGVLAPATIQSVSDTGTRINNAAIIKLKLQVKPPNDAPFEASVIQEVSVLSGFSGYSTGGALQVKYDPNNKRHITVLDRSTASSAKSKSARPAKPSSYGYSASSNNNTDSEAAPSDGYERRPTSADFGEHYNFGQGDDSLSKKQQKMAYEERQRQHQQAQNHPQHHPPQSGGPGTDIAEELARLSELHKGGELSDSEYAAAKKKLLG